MIVAITAVLFWCVRCALTLPDPDLDRLSRDAMLQALELIGMTHKQAYGLMGFSQGHWAEICAGRKALPSHRRMLALGVEFWMAFLPLMARVATHMNVIEVWKDAQVRAAVKKVSA